MMRILMVAGFSLALGLLAGGLRAGEKPQMIEGWGQVEDPDKDCKISIKDGRVSLTIPPGHDLWPKGGKTNAPRILKEVEGDFSVQVKVASSVKAENGFFRAGTLLIWQDDKTFIRLDSACADRGKNKLDFYCYLHVFKDEVRSVNEHLRPLKDEPTHLRLTRRDNKVVASYSQDGGKQWKSFGEKTVDLQRKLRVGVAGVNGTKDPFTVTLEDFKITK